MLSFQKLRVYQRSIEFLALALEIIGELPRGLQHARGSAMEAAAGHEVGGRAGLRSRNRSCRRDRGDAHENDLIASRSTSKVAFMFRFTSMYVDVNIDVLI